MAKPRLNRISIILDEFNFTQLDLSIYLNVGRNTVSRWCRNTNQPDLEMIYKIAEFFRIDNRRLFEPTNWDNDDNKAPYEIYLENKAKKESKEKKTKK